MAFGSKNGACRIAAGKFIAFCSGKLTALTSCGGIDHSVLVDRLAQLGQLLRGAEFLGAHRVAERVARHHFQAVIVRHCSG